jgi:hypothetical protein
MSIIVNDNGFSIQLTDKTKAVNWTEIQQIEAYKVNLITTDEICIEVELQESILTITEETNGWNEFIEKILIVFPEIDKNWWSKVAHPPFQTNHLILYKKS